MTRRTYEEGREEGRRRGRDRLRRHRPARRAAADPGGRSLQPPGRRGRSDLLPASPPPRAAMAPPAARSSASTSPSASRRRSRPASSTTRSPPVCAKHSSRPSGRRRLTRPADPGVVDHRLGWRTFPAGRGRRRSRRAQSQCGRSQDRPARGVEANLQRSLAHQPRLLLRPQHARGRLERRSRPSTNRSCRTSRSSGDLYRVIRWMLSRTRSRA